MMVRERRHRLPRSAYVGTVVVAFTACEKGRRPGLADASVFEAMVDRLQQAVARCGCSVPIFVAMPDHIHVLIRGLSDTSDTKEAMERFKTASGLWLYRHRPELHWQKDYWDHILREHESWEHWVRYIAENPCRAGLAADPLAWPYSTAIGHDLQAILAETSL